MAFLIECGSQPVPATVLQVTGFCSSDLSIIRSEMDSSDKVPIGRCLKSNQKAISKYERVIDSYVDLGSVMTVEF